MDQFSNSVYTLWPKTQPKLTFQLPFLLLSKPFFLNQLISIRSAKTKLKNGEGDGLFSPYSDDGGDAVTSGGIKRRHESRVHAVFGHESPGIRRVHIRDRFRIEAIVLLQQFASVVSLRSPTLSVELQLSRRSL